MLEMMRIYNQTQGQIGENFIIKLVTHLAISEQKTLTISSVSLAAFKVSIEKYQENPIIWKNQV